MNRLPIKLFLVITLVLFCSSMPAGAAPNWNAMLETPSAIYQIDKDTIKLTGEAPERQLEVWVRMVFKDQSGSSIVSHYLIRERDMTFLLKERTIYLSSGTATSTVDATAAGWKETTENSPLGQIAKQLFSRDAKPELTAAQWVEKGKAYFNSNDYASAILAYDQAIQLDPQRDQPFAERGKSLLLTKQFDRALADFTKASELNPNNSDYVWLRGLTYAGKGQHQLAIDQYKRTLEIDPKMYLAYWNIALSYERLAMPKLAVEFYTNFVQIAPPEYPNFDKAKKRLEELRGVSEKEELTGAINKTIEASQIKSIVLDYQAIDYLTINFDKPRWKIGYQQIDKNVIMEFVTSNETVQNWSELITVQFFGDSKNLTPQQYVAFTEKRNRGIFGDKMTFSVLHISDADAIIEYRVSGHAKVPDEHTITRVFKGKGSLGFVHYAAKPFMTENQRAIGLSLLQGVRYSDHFPQ